MLFLLHANNRLKHLVPNFDTSKHSRRREGAGGGGGGGVGSIPRVKVSVNSGPWLLFIRSQLAICQLSVDMFYFLSRSCPGWRTTCEIFFQLSLNCLTFFRL